MGKKLYVGNLPFSLTEQGLKEIFSQAGNVESVAIIKDRATGRSKGFGFVEMSTDDEAQAAVSRLNGADCEGRPMTVAEARPQQGGGGPREGGGGGGGRIGGDRGNR